MKIHTLGETQVIIDDDISELYQVDTAYLKRLLKRHIEWFDEEDFMFQLADEELEYLRCQIGTAKFAKTQSLPFAFTELGVYLLATVLIGIESMLKPTVKEAVKDEIIYV